MKALKRILLVEDDPKDIELTLAALSEHNLANEVVVARDGVEALDYLYCRESFAQRPAGNPVVILLDLKMPRLDGIQVLRQIKDDWPKVRVIIITAHHAWGGTHHCHRFMRESIVPIGSGSRIDSILQDPGD